MVWLGEAWSCRDVDSEYVYVKHMLNACCRQPLCHTILEFFSQKAYYSWKRLWGSHWHIRGRVSWERGRGPWALSALCLGLDFPYTVRMSHSAFHLLFASSRHKLTVDVLTRPASERTAASIDGRRAWLRGGVSFWQPVKADSAGWLAVPELSDQFVEISYQAAAYAFVMSFRALCIG